MLTAITWEILGPLLELAALVIFNWDKIATVALLFLIRRELRRPRVF